HTTPQELPSFPTRRSSDLKEWLRIAILFSPLLAVTAQDIDANITAQNRKPTSIADQISNASERAAFLALFLPTPPEQRLEQAQSDRKSTRLNSNANISYAV